MEDRTLLSSFLVTTTADSGPGSLRAAILESNAATGTTNTIDFGIPGSGVHTIVPASPLPTITRSVLIDGFSQPGYAGTPVVEIDGSQAGTGDGLLITGQNVTVRGLDISNFRQGAGIHLTGTASTGDWIYGNFLGTDPTGTGARPNNSGVEIDGGASDNLVGTNGDGVSDASERNLLSGNLFAGVWITGQGTDRNAVAGNLIGARISGDVALNNGTQPVYYYYYQSTLGGGVVIENGASYNRIGTDGESIDDAGERNVIAGSNNDGVDIAGNGTSEDIVAGNFIGTDATGTSALGIAGDGVFIAEGANSNWIGVNPIGGTAFADEGNVISGTGYDGVQIFNTSNSNVVAGNLIGTDVTGTVALGNSGQGVEIDAGAFNNIIGDTDAGAGNVISANGQNGVWITGSGASGNWVESNLIGTDITGTQDLGNAQSGVQIDTGAFFNTVGGTTAAAGNLITSNGGAGVVVGNEIGDPSGSDQITSNSIFGNQGQAIDLGNDGVTYNASAPSQGPNNLQNFPIIVTTPLGGLEGWLGGSSPETTFRIDVYAGATYGPGGAGEAQDDLGSFDVTTDSTGQVTFAVPFTAPAGLPIITATATDPLGNTSEVSAVRRDTLQGPFQLPDAVPGMPLIFSTASGNGIALQDPDAGPLDPEWNLTLSGPGETLTLGSTAGLTGSGDGSGSLAYSGPLSALNAALQGLELTIPPGSSGLATLSLNATSTGALPLGAQLQSANGVFFVKTTADSGTGSLRQAILESNAATGSTSTIDFDIPGQGVQTIAPSSPLPAITSPVLIDGTSQPGYAGTPLVELSGSQARTGDGLLITSPDVTVCGLDIDNFSSGACIHITGAAATGDWIYGNFLGNSSAGMDVDTGASDNTIGGTTASAGNLITSNGGPGVVVGNSLTDTTVGDQISSNSIFGNQGPAIDLGGTGVIYNASAPQQGPNNLQNFPIIVATDDGSLEGWLGGSAPDTTFRIDVFASAGYGPGGAGEAEDFLGSLNVTTDSSGQVSFAVPFTAPAGLPIITATATDPLGNTSELSAVRRDTLQGPTQALRIVPGAPLIVSNALGNGIELLDPDAGPLDPEWNLTLSVPVGTLTLAGTAGLTGSGDGTGSLSYSGSLSALNTALDGLEFTPPPGFHGDTTPSLNATSEGAAPLQGQSVITDGIFFVTTTADSGPGSLRQAILDENAANGGTNTIDFDIPGQGVQTISPASPLPAIANPVLIDGFSQPGYDGTPLIELFGNQVSLGDGLAITGPDVTVRGLDINSFSQGAGIHITGTGATGDSVYGNLLGTDPTGTQAAPNLVGVAIEFGANNNLVGNGASDASDRNLISGNTYSGVLIDGFGSDGNVVEGNLVGTTVTGDTALPNGQGPYFNQYYQSTFPGTGGGVAIDYYASGNLVIDNVISGNNNLGVELFGSGTSGNVVQGNVIGADLTGTLNLGNSSAGIEIDTGASNNTIGGTTASAGNLITSNGGPGVVVGNLLTDTTVGDQVSSNSIFGNQGPAIDLGGAGVIYNASAPQLGPNNLQNFPIIVATADGSLEGWLGGSAPDTTFRIDVFASAGYGPGGAGEAQDYLGSLNVTTDSSGQVSFAVPFTAPAGLPIITATATDPLGNTSELSAARRDSLQAPSQLLDVVSPGYLILSTASGNGIELLDPDAGPLPLAPVWNLTLSASVGTLILASTAGLTGAGDGTGSLSYSGPLSAIDAALASLDYISPAPGSEGFATISLSATSEGASPLQTQLHITDGFFCVTTTADSGPGSLRQAILDSNLGTNSGTNTNTIDFDIPGPGVETIDLASPLPPITTSVLIDGTTQPGFGGTSQVALDDQPPGSPGPITIAGGDVTIRALPIDSVTIDATSAGYLVADLHSQGQSNQLSLLNTLGQVAVQSDGLSPADTDAAIAEHVADGDYLLDGGTTGTPGTVTWTILFTPSSAPFQTIPVGKAPSAIVSGDFAGNGRIDLAVANSEDNTVSVLLANGDGTFGPPVAYAVGSNPVAIAAGDFTGDGELDLAVANRADGTVSVLLGNGDGTFGSQVTYAAGSGPDAIVAGEFTGDGHLDLAVANAGSNTVSVLLGNGDGTFEPQVTYAVGSNPDAIAAGDFAGNGHLDLAVANFYDDTVSVLLGNGDGTFGPKVTYNVGYYPEAMVAADFRANGHVDLAVANQGGTVSVLLSNGNGTFGPQVTYAVGLDAGAIVAGDFTGDGHLDLAVANGGEDTVSVLLGNGDGTFGPQVTYAVGAGPDAIVAADFTANGHLDLAVANSGDNTVSVLLGNGNGTFQSQAVQPRVTYAVGADPDAIVAGDFTGNGRLDLAVANAKDDSVSVLLGNGDGTFLPQGNYPVGSDPDAIVAGDFNGDGHLDLAVANAADGTVSVLLGNGDGTFGLQVTYAVGSDPDAIVAGDFTGDGRLDLAVANSGDGTVSVLLGKGDGTFRTQVIYAVGTAPDALVAGDFTGDGDLDVAVANSDCCAASGGGYGGGGGTAPPGNGTVSVLLNNGDGTFGPQVTYAVGMVPDAIVAGDFTGDGPLDLAVANADAVPASGSYGGGSTPQWGTGTVSVLLGNGDGTFGPQVTYAVGSDPDAIVPGDFTGNGQLDLAVTNANNGTLSVLLGNGNGSFQPQVTYAVGTVPDAIVAGDFTGNGRLDLAVANEHDGTVSVLLNAGNAGFQPQVISGLGSSPSAIVAGDFTSNGQLDLAVANSEDNTVSVLLGNGDGTFLPQVTYGVGADPDAIVAGDFTGDGDLDLAVVNAYGGTVSVLLGNGDGTFQPQVTYNVGNSPRAIVAGDFTGNGDLDLAVANGFDGTVSVLLGNGDGTFQPQVTYAVGTDPDAIAVGDFTGDGRLDLAVADAGDLFSWETVPGAVSVLLGNGDGTFQPQVTYAAGTDPDAIVAGDFTGNGRLDLAVVDGGQSYYWGWAPGEVSVFAGNGDGTFQPQVTYAVGSEPSAIVAGDFTGDGQPDLAVANSGDDTVSVLLGNGDGTFQPQVTYAVGSNPDGIVAGDFARDGQTGLADVNGGDGTVSVLLGNGGGTFASSAESATVPHATPLVADVTGNGTDDVLVVDGSGNILFRQGIPGQPGTFQPPIPINPGFPSRDIAWVPNTDQGPVLASVDAHDNAISFYAWRNGGFVRLQGSLVTGQLPGQIIAADLNGTGITDLVVRNAGDGTLSVYFGTTPISGSFTDPVDPQLFPPDFLPPVTLHVGLGVSDVEAVDTTGDGRLDLVVTNEVTAQVSVLLNLGNGRFAAPVLYRAGAEISAISDGSPPKVNSLEATAGVAAGSLTPGGPTSLVTMNPSSNTIDVLAGLGGGRFANPVTIGTASPAQVVRMADFTGNGADDLAVLTAGGLSIYLANGQGGFLPPTTYAVPPQSDGLTVADLTGNGKLDLLVGDAYGDVLVLIGNGNGTFEPYHEANQEIELAVADLTGNGSEDVIYADQGLDQVVVDYGASQSTILADRSSGLLDPGGITLADVNGDHIPDLIVANSGGNNVLIYPGLGNGQFGPSINDGNGYFVGTNPVGITVAYLTGRAPDLIVADKGSNQVSILLNNSSGGKFSFTLGPRLNTGGVGPVSTVIGSFTGGLYPDLLVTNSGSNDVTMLPGVGPGFFNDQHPTVFVVGSDPVASFVGNFNGTPDLLTVNAGSSDLTLISGFEGENPVTSTMASGGIDPSTAFDFSTGNGFEDLVVGNTGDGVLALFEGGSDGLSLDSAETEPNVPDPTALAFADVNGGAVQFYAATEGREAVALVALSLGGEITTVTTLSLSPTVAVPQLVPLEESSLALAGTLLIVTVEPSFPAGEVPSFSAGEVPPGVVEPAAEAVAALSSSSAQPLAVGQGLAVQGLGGVASGALDVSPANPDEPGASVPAPEAGVSWQRLILDTDEAINRFNRAHRELFPERRDDGGATSPTKGPDPNPPRTQQNMPARQSTSPSAARRLDAIDRAIELRDGVDPISLENSSGGERPASVPWYSRVADRGPTVRLTVAEVPHRHGTPRVRTHLSQKTGQSLDQQSAEDRFRLSASLALAATVAGAACIHGVDRRGRTRPFLAGLRGWRVPQSGGEEARAQGG